MSNTALSLKPRYELFCIAYWSNGGNATKAALAAGYAAKHAATMGHALLKRPEIRFRVDELKAAYMARSMITVDRLDAELARIAFANLEDYVRVDADGNVVPDLTAATRDQMAGLTEVSIQEQRSEGKYGPSESITRKVKIGNKLGALELLLKRRGALVEKHAMDHTGNVTVQHEMSPREIARRIAFALTLGLNQPEPVGATDPGAGEPEGG